MESRDPEAKREANDHSFSERGESFDFAQDDGVKGSSHYSNEVDLRLALRRTCSPQPSSGRDNPGLFQGAVCSILIDRLKPPRRYPNADELLDLGYPDAVLMQVGMKFTPHVLGYVPPYATFFLRQTAAMNNASARDAGPGNTANLRHDR